MGPLKSCCICYCSITLFWIVVLIAIITYTPKVYVQDFYIPALNTSSGYNSSTLNTSVFMDLKFKRVFAFIDQINYVDLNVTLFYNSNTSFSIGYYVHPGFVQGYKKTVYRKVVVEARDPPWGDALQKLSAGSTAPFTVVLGTKYKVKQCNKGECSYTKTMNIVLAADVRLDGSGRKVSKKPIRLR